jgi:Rrf2 family protein
MLKLSKKVDYALILLGRMAQAGLSPAGTESPLAAGPGSFGPASSAREMAERYGLPQPMVANILKSLTGAGILTSMRGAQGGYTLARESARISLAELVEALDGPIGLMDCTTTAVTCEHQSGCPMHSPIQRVHEKFHAFMASYTLADIFEEADPRRLRRMLPHVSPHLSPAPHPTEPGLQP